MKTIAWATALVVAGSVRLVADQTNGFDRKRWVDDYLPGCVLQADKAGKPTALVSPAGEWVDLTVIAGTLRSPKRKDAAGYWFSPTMDFLGRQELRAGTGDEAENVVKLLHVLQEGPSFVEQKIYHARPFAGGWTVEADHEFATYPGNVMAISPYELLVDDHGNVVLFRQRCYRYRGSASVYSNTVITVYEREIKRDRGKNYPEALFEELRKEWAKEKARETSERNTAEDLQETGPGEGVPAARDP